MENMQGRSVSHEVASNNIVPNDNDGFTIKP